MTSGNRKSKLVAAVLATAMILTMVPIMAFATEKGAGAEGSTPADNPAQQEEQVQPEEQIPQEEQVQPEENTDENVPVKKPVKKKVVNKKKVRIMLDAGHAGNYNRGAIRKFFESRMTWKLTNYLKKELKKYGFTVGMTKKNLWHDPKVYKRGKMARGYDLFVSIHSNWAGAKYVDYPLAIVSSKHKKKLYKKAQPVGKKLVKQVKATMKTRQKAKVWIKRQKGGKDWYGVIRGAAAVNVPAVILEHSFHSNPGKCRWLMKDKNLKRMAAAEAKVLAKHYGMKKVR